MAADYFSTQLTSLDAGTHLGAGDYKQGFYSRPIFRGTFDLAGAIAKSETLAMVRLPIGAIPYMCWLLSSVTLNTAVVSIGISGTAAKYRALATFTTAGQWVPFMIPASMTALTAVEEIWITNDATAAVPTSGDLEMAFECIMP